MISRRLLLTGSAASGLAALPGQVLPPRARRGDPDRGRHLPSAMVSRKLAGARGRSCGGQREEEAPRHHVGAARLPVLQGNPSGQFRKAGDLGLHPAALRNSSTEYDRLARGRRFRRREAVREAAGAEIRRALHADLPVFPRSAAALAGKAPREREVARAQGYMQPPQFLAMFRFVSERAYEKGSLPDYLKANS